MPNRLREMQRLYEGGSVYARDAWKFASDELIDAEVIRKIYFRLYKVGVIPSYDKGFAFLSPSSHIPTHEKILFDLDIEHRKLPSIFVASDIRQISPYQIHESVGDSHFFMLQADANELPFGDKFFNVIWDRKGALWHAATASQVEVESVLSSFKKILVPGGSVVIDAIEEVPDLDALNIIQALAERYIFRRHISPKNLVNASSQFETSTWYRLAKYSQEIEDAGFRIRHLGTGKESVIILTKKR